MLRGKLLDLAEGHLFFHSGAVVHDGHALLMAGPSGAGKSTITAALVSRGYQMFSDDLAAIHRASGRLAPFPLAIRLSHEPASPISLSKFDRFTAPLPRPSADDKCYLLPKHAADCETRTTRLTVLLLDRDTSQRMTNHTRPVYRSMSSGEALLSMGMNLYGVSWDRASCQGSISVKACLFELANVFRQARFYYLRPGNCRRTADMVESILLDGSGKTKG